MTRFTTRFKFLKSYKKDSFQVHLIDKIEISTFRGSEVEKNFISNSHYLDIFTLGSNATIATPFLPVKEHTLI